MRVARTITVSTSAVAFHRWKGAKGKRAYLSDPHRHRFNVAVTIEVQHNDREVEFHDLLDFVEDHCALFHAGAKSPSPERNPYMDWSCESHAEHILHFLTNAYPTRCVAVTVDEDGECAATLTLNP